MVDFSTQDIIYISAETIVGFVTIVGNAIVLVAIISTKSLHTITNVFIGNLAIADIAVGCFVAPSAALSFLGLPGDKYGCIFINCAILMFTNISILMLLTIALERFVAIRFPFTYKKHATVKRSVFVNLSIWVVGSVLGLLPMFGWNTAPDELSRCAFTDIISMEYMVYFQFFTITLTPLFIMLCIYLYIFFIVRQHSKQTRTLENLFQDPQTASRHRRRWDKDVQAAKMFATLFFLFGLFWLPINIMNSITLFCPTCRSPYELLLTTIVLSHANSSVNPFLYAANNSRIRMAIKNLLSLKQWQQSQFDSNSQAPTSQPPRENRPPHNETLSRAGSKEQVHENCQKVSVSSQGSNENVENAFHNTTTKVSFVTEHIDANEVTASTHEPKQEEANTIQTLRVLNRGMNHSHSFRDEIDHTIFDRITPVEGMMANIYSSLDSDMRDIIEGRGKWAENNTQNTPELVDDLNGCDVNMTPFLDPPIKSAGKDEGLVNHAFVDEESRNENEGSVNANISFIKINEPCNGVSTQHPCSSSPHALHAPSLTSKPIPTPKLLRSYNMSSSDGLSNSISQDSAVNIMTNGNDLSESTLSINTQQLLATSQNDQNNSSTGSPLIINSTIDSPNSCLSSRTLPGVSPSTTQNLFVMESEIDNSIMSDKYFEESQDPPKSVGSSGSKYPLDDRAILKNRLSEVTHL